MQLFVILPGRQVETPAVLVTPERLTQEALSPMCDKFSITHTPIQSIPALTTHMKERRFLA
jgi:hypothetical protein